MKIAIVCPYAFDEPGGVQEQVAQLTRHLNETGHNAWIVAPGTSGPPGIRLVGRKVNVRADQSLAPICLDPFSIRRVRESLEDADLVHIHEPFVPLVSWAALAGQHRPIIGTFHANLSPFLQIIGHLSLPFWRRLARHMTAVTAVSTVAAEPLSPLFTNIIIIPDAIDVKSYDLNVKRHLRRVLFLGRDEPRKGLNVLLKAWSRVRAEIPDAELIVLGTSRKTSLPSVHFFPRRTEDAVKQRELAAAAVFCSPNLGRESFGITILEAMAAGCAVVASDIPAFRGVLGEAGIFTPPGDSRALAEALIRLLRDPTAIREAGDKNRKRAERFDWSVVLPRYLELYRTVTH